MTIRSHIAHLWNVRGAFRRCLLGPDGKPTNDGAIVLKELRYFCYMTRPPIKSGLNGIDPYASMVATGRQEVGQRIFSMLNLDDGDLHALERRAQMEDEAHG